MSDAVLGHLRAVADTPDVSGTRYELVEPIGRGGMGVVWRALDRQLERDVALKILDEPDPTLARALAARLVQEAKVLAQLEHPGIVPVHDVGVLADGRAFCAMKLVRGRRLDALMLDGLDEAARARIFGRVGEAVAFAHARGVIHRDLKPANVMVGEFGEVLVIDWGLAQVAAAGGAVIGERVGTPGFMAPEQERGDGAVDARADVFALGALLRGLEADVASRPLAAIVAKATAPAPADRYASVAELCADVEAWRVGAAVTAFREGWLGGAARLYRRHRPIVWLIVAYLVLRIGFELVRRGWR